MTRQESATVPHEEDIRGTEGMRFSFGTILEFGGLWLEEVVCRKDGEAAKGDKGVETGRMKLVGDRYLRLQIRSQPLPTVAPDPSVIGFVFQLLVVLTTHRNARSDLGGPMAFERSSTRPLSSSRPWIQE